MNTHILQTTTNIYEIIRITYWSLGIDKTNFPKKNNTAGLAKKYS